MFNRKHKDLFAKVRWEDIFSANYGNDYLKYRGFLRSRNVDFIIINPNTGDIKILIELISSYNYSKKDQIRYKRLKEFCEDTGLHLMLISTKRYYDRDIIKNKIAECLKDKTQMVYKI